MQNIIPIPILSSKTIDGKHTYAQNLNLLRIEPKKVYTIGYNDTKPGNGQTTTAICVAAGQVLQGKFVLYFTMENTHYNIHDRVISQINNRIMTRFVAIGYNPYLQTIGFQEIERILSDYGANVIIIDPISMIEGIQVLSTDQYIEKSLNLAKKHNISVVLCGKNPYELSEKREKNTQFLIF